jgi:hypothetical protein
MFSTRIATAARVANSERSKTATPMRRAASICAPRLIEAAPPLLEDLRPGHRRRREVDEEEVLQPPEAVVGRVRWQWPRLREVEVDEERELLPAVRERAHEVVDSRRGGDRSSLSAPLKVGW